MATSRVGAVLALPLSAALAACTTVDWSGPPALGGSSSLPSNGGSSSSGSGGVDGQGAQGGNPSGGGSAGSGESGGTNGGAGGAPLFACPADDGTARALTLAGFGPSDSVDAGAPSADAGDAGNPGDAGDAGGPSGDDESELEFAGLAIPGLVGWASSPGFGSATTIGGAAGDVVTARTAEELIDFASRVEPLVIRICGTVRAPEVKVSSHKTLLGVGSSATVEGGLLIGGEADYTRNVIVKNLRVHASYSTVRDEGIRIEHAHHVWLDHNEVFDGAGDAAIDVVNGSDFVTLSWNKIHFTPDAPDREHRFGCRIGDHNMDDTEARALDTGHLNVTLHHNWFATDVRQRAPRVRFGKVHLFNNFYTIEDLPNDYSIWASTESKLLVENNYFRGVTNPHELNTPDAELLASGNIYDGTGGLSQSTGTAFTPPYDYALDPALGVPTALRAGTGPR